MLLQSLRALCKAPGGSGSIWKYLEALVRATGVSGRFACGFRTDLHFAGASSLNNSRVADITQCVASTPSATLRQSINTPTATPGTSSHSTPAPRGTSQTDPTRRVLSSSASGIASTPTPLSRLENLPTHIPNPEACTIITNPL